MEDYLEDVIGRIRETEKALRVSVKIPHDEVDRLVVSRLIRVRNSEVNKSVDMSHFDQVIRHYLTEDEFEKYVIEKQPLE